MAIRLTTPDGFQYEADSAEEAVKIQQLLQPPHASQPAAKPLRRSELNQNNGKPPETFSLDRIDDDFGELGASVLRALATTTEGLSTDELSRQSAIPTSKLPPIIRAVRAKASRMFAENVILRNQIYVGHRPKSLYQLSDKALKAMQQKN